MTSVGECVMVVVGWLLRGVAKECAGRIELVELIYFVELMVKKKYLRASWKLVVSPSLW